LLNESMEYPSGLTIRELKCIIKDWPETNGNGELTIVWLSATSGHSVQAYMLSRLGEADLLIGEWSA